MADLEEIMGDKGGPASEAPVPNNTAPEPAGEPVQAQPQDQPTDQHQDDTDPVTGLRRALDEERGKRRKYRDELAEVRQQYARLEGVLTALNTQRQQPQQPAPQPQPDDIFTDPTAFVTNQVRGAIDPVQKAMMFNARLVAESVYDREKPGTVKSAVDAFDQAVVAGQIHPSEKDRIMSSPNPFYEAVQWHQRNAALSEIGTDPAAYRERLKAELLAELGQPAQQSSQGGLPPNMPSSFATARSAGPRSTPQWSGPKPLSEILNR
jgi:hypothetical protein